MSERQVLVEGKGLAGYNLSAELSQAGYDVLNTGREFKARRSWFVLGNRMPEEVIEACRKGEIASHELTGCRFVIVTGEDRVDTDFTVDLGGELPPMSCLMIDDKETKAFYRRKAQKSEVDFDPSRAVGVATDNANGKINVLLQDRRNINVDIAVDASGSESVLLRNVNPNALDDDPWVLWARGARVTGEFDPNLMVFPLANKNTGRLSWITPWSDNEADVIASDYCRLSEYSQMNAQFDETFERFVALSERLRVCRVGEVVEPIRGKIRLLPINNGFNDRIHAVGDSAGMACPNMAEGVPTAIRQSTNLFRHIVDGRSPKEYHRDWRYGRNREYPYPLSMAFLHERVGRDQAGGNIKLYENIAGRGSPATKLRLLTERKLGLSDIPEILAVARKDPLAVARGIKILTKAGLMNFIPKWRQELYYGVNGR